MAKLKQELTATETSIKNVKSRGVEMSEIILNSADALTSADDATVQYKDSLYELVDGFDELVGITRESNDESEKTVEVKAVSLGIAKGLQGAFCIYKSVIGAEQAIRKCLQFLAFFVNDRQIIQTGWMLPGSSQGVLAT